MSTYITHKLISCFVSYITYDPIKPRVFDALGRLGGANSASPDFISVLDKLEP